MTKEKRKWLVIVNFITCLRIIGTIILFPIYFACGQIAVGCILSFLFLTDWIDGYLARKHKVSTFFGSIMDSVSDKLMAIASCIILCFINSYMIYSIIIEFLIIIVNTFVFTQKGNIQSSYIGKIKTWILSLCIILGFFICKSDTKVINICIAAPAILAEFITLFDYVKKALKIKVNITTEKPKYKKMKEINQMLFSPEFYEKNKNNPGLIDNLYENGK